MYWDSKESNEFERLVKSKYSQELLIWLTLRYFHLFRLNDSLRKVWGWMQVEKHKICCINSTRWGVGILKKQLQQHHHQMEQKQRQRHLQNQKSKSHNTLKHKYEWAKKLYEKRTFIKFLEFKDKHQMTISKEHIKNLQLNYIQIKIMHHKRQKHLRK